MEKIAFFMLILLNASAIIASEAHSFLPDLSDKEEVDDFEKMQQEFSQPSHEEGSGYENNIKNDPELSTSILEPEDDVNVWDESQFMEQIKKCEQMAKYHNKKRHKICDSLPIEIWNLKRKVDNLVDEMISVKRKEWLEKSNKRNHGSNTGQVNN